MEDRLIDMRRALDSALADHAPGPDDSVLWTASPADSLRAALKPSFH
jgi:hypothetical protein